MGAKNSKYEYSNTNFDVNDWIDVTSETEQTIPQHGKFQTLKNIGTLQLVDKYQNYFTSTKDYEDYLLSYEWRKNENFIVRAYYLITKNNSQYCSKTYQTDLYIEHPKNRLSDFRDIPFPDTLYVLKAMLTGYSKLYENVGAFPVKEQQVCIDQLGNLKVWLNQNLSKNYPEDWQIEPKTKSSDQQQQQMVYQILKVIDRNSDQQSEPHPTFLQVYEQNRQKQRMGFKETITLISSFAQRNNTTIPTYFISVVQVYQDQDQLYQNEFQPQDESQTKTSNHKSKAEFEQASQRFENSVQQSQIQRVSQRSLSKQSNQSQIDDLNRNRMRSSNNHNKGQSYRLSNLSKLQQNHKPLSVNQVPPNFPVMRHYSSRENVRPSDQSQANYSHISNPNQPHIFQPMQAYIPSAPNYQLNAITNSRSATNFNGSQFNGSQYTHQQQKNTFSQQPYQGYGLQTQNSVMNRTHSVNSQNNMGVKYQNMLYPPTAQYIPTHVPGYAPNTTYMPTIAYNPNMVYNPSNNQHGNINQHKKSNRAYVNNSISEQTDENQNNESNYRNQRSKHTQKHSQKNSRVGQELALSWANEKYQKQLQQQASYYNKSNSKAISMNSPNQTDKNRYTSRREGEQLRSSKSDYNNGSIYRSSIKSAQNIHQNGYKKSHNSNLSNLNGKKQQKKIKKQTRDSHHSKRYKNKQKSHHTQSQQQLSQKNSNFQDQSMSQQKFKDRNLQQANPKANSYATYQKATQFVNSSTNYSQNHAPILSFPTFSNNLIHTNTSGHRIIIPPPLIHGHGQPIPYQFQGARVISPPNHPSTLLVKNNSYTHLPGMQNPNGMNNLHAMGIHSPNILPYHQNPAELQNNKAFFKTQNKRSFMPLLIPKDIILQQQSLDHINDNELNDMIHTANFRKKNNIQNTNPLLSNFSSSNKKQKQHHQGYCSVQNDSIMLDPQIAKDLQDYI